LVSFKSYLNRNDHAKAWDKSPTLSPRTGALVANLNTDTLMLSLTEGSTPATGALANR
jgi:hypothetical protein